MCDRMTRDMNELSLQVIVPTDIGWTLGIDDWMIKSRILFLRDDDAS